MRSFASVVKGENAHPNKSVTNGMHVHVHPAKKLPTDTVSKLFNVSYHVIKQTTTKQPQLKKIIHGNRHQKKALTHHRQDNAHLIITRISSSFAILRSNMPKLFKLHAVATIT